ncbi:MAG: leucyl aminopeptidase [Candidatus Uhrbacteria bacterium]
MSDLLYTYTNELPLDAKVDALVFAIVEIADKKLPGQYKHIDEALGGQLSAVVKSGDFTGEEYGTLCLYNATSVSAQRVLLIGIGKPKDWNRTGWQHVVGTAARALQQVKAKSAAFVLPKEYLKKLKIEELGELFEKAFRVSTYQFTDYKTDKKATLPTCSALTIAPLMEAQAQQFAAGVAMGAIIADAVNAARRLGDTPSSDATPTHLAEHAVALGKTDKRFRVKVLERADMERLKMGALLGVARGAETPPKFIVVEWHGNKRASKTWYALVGKAITFDSGGISLKPGEKMDEMKFDMGGGAVVLGAMRGIGALGLPVNIVGIVPATENMPGGRAQKPGDIVKTCRGKTIEILNTDAEGRLILADGIGYAHRYQPQAIVDLATLTGACMIALGSHYAGLFSNNTPLFKQANTAAELSGDRAWHLPLADAYTREIKSDIADWQNLSKVGRYGGAITAAALLEQMAEEKPWAHFDIAGTAWATEAKSWLGKGATGYGVHLLIELARDWAKK